jgi:hypothetical protein
MMRHAALPRTPVSPPHPAPPPFALPVPSLRAATGGDAQDDGVEIIETRHPGPHAFLLKARGSGQFYQVAPARDPQQPRFWCVVVYRCSPGGLADTTERPWVGPGGITRENLPLAMAEIRADVGAWLAEEPCRELRSWLLAPAAAPPSGG